MSDKPIMGKVYRAGICRISCLKKKKAIFLESAMVLKFQIDMFLKALFFENCGSKEFIQDYKKYDWNNFEIAYVECDNKLVNSEAQAKDLEKRKQE